jgi:predicted esterase
MRTFVLLAAVCVCCASPVTSQDTTPAAPVNAANGAGDFAGEWRTSIGMVTITQSGADVTGVYGNAGQFTLQGTVQGNKLTFQYQEGQARGDAHWTLDDAGHSFRGGFQVRGGRAGEWNGWRPDPDAAAGESANLSGLWLTDLGLMELEQTGDAVEGRYAVRGGSEIKGTVKGRRLEFEYSAFRPGRGWFDVESDGAAFAGAAGTDGFPGWYGWRGRRAPEYARHPAPAPGQIIDGSTNGLLTYSIRAPEGYHEGDDRKWPAVVILHGSNMGGRAYVSTMAAAWPDVARDYLLIGINGERPSAIGDDPRFNYTYVNYVGRSTFQGFPGTDRESPALVAEALDELRDAYSVSRFFIGGHSQGGFLTYCVLMNFPEKVAGAFPISAGVIVQCEPSAYADEALRAAQRGVPLAIIHGRNDPVVGFSSGEYAATLYAEAGWPAFRFFADESGAGHRFGLLPVGEAIRWLEQHSSDDPARLLDFAEARLKDGGYRDGVAALNRCHGLRPTDASVRARLDLLSEEVDARARTGAAEFLPRIRNAAPGETWIDAFLVYRDDFEFAPAAREVMEAFAALRAEHEGPAREVLNTARTSFRAGRRDEGYVAYEQITEQHYAASSYRNVKRWLGERK